MSAAAAALAAFLLAYANGANDNFKGVATLHGSGTTPYRTALLWGTGATFLSSVAAIFLGGALLRTFSGHGLVPAAVAGSPGFLPAVAAGAAGTVLLATRVGLPISTTHALVGSLAGAGVAAAQAELRAAALLQSFLLPLLLSPLVALAVTGLAYRALPDRWRAPRPARGGRLPVPAHYLSAAAISFGRGVNDTPKIAALLLGTAGLEGPAAVGMVGGVIALGGLLGSRRVANTLSCRITRMDHSGGLSANLVSAALLLIASPLGMPVSTTHVSCGALFGLGAACGTARRRTVTEIVGAWVGTLPLAAALGGLAFLLLGA